MELEKKKAKFEESKRKKDEMAKVALAMKSVKKMK